MADQANRSETSAGRGSAVTGPRQPARKFVVGVSGASGAAYALRLLEQLLVLGHEVHFVVTDYGRRLLFDVPG